MDDIDLSSVKPLLQRLCIAPDKTHMGKIAFLLIELAHGDAGDAHIFLYGDPAVLRIAFRHLVPVISLAAADLQVQFLPVNERSPAPFQLRGILDDQMCIRDRSSTSMSRRSTSAMISASIIASSSS